GLCRAVDAAGRAADVQGLAGVLLQVHPLDPYPDRLAVDVHVQPPVDAERLVVLADLEVLRHVRVEVVLPGEPAPARDAAVEREPDPDGRLDRGAVGDGQATGQTQAYRTDLAVDLGAEVGRAAAEHLRTGAELDVGFETDHRLEPRDGILEG